MDTAFVLSQNSSSKAHRWKSQDKEAHLNDQTNKHTVSLDKVMKCTLFVTVRRRRHAQAHCMTCPIFHHLPGGLTKIGITTLQSADTV